MADDQDAGRSTRFKTGRSGNPKGRPRRPKIVETGSSFDVLMDRRVTISIEGVDREVPVDEALLHRTYQDALDDDRMAIRTILKAIMELDALRTPTTRRVPTFSSLYPDPADIDEALIVLGIAAQVPDCTRRDGRPYLKLEPWAVNSALGRHKRISLGSKALAELKDDTRNPESVDWPRGGEG